MILNVNARNRMLLQWMRPLTVVCCGKFAAGTFRAVYFEAGSIHTVKLALAWKENAKDSW